MHRIHRSLFALAAAAILFPFTASSAAAQDADSVRIATLEQQIDAITRELERLALGRDVVVADSAVAGFGAAASRVYRIDSGVSVGGYGEVLYQNFMRTDESGAARSTSDAFDALRAIIYVGYKFNDRLLFNSEIEIEHANEAFLEFAYIEYRLNDDVGVRGGLLLAPMGFVNELHEPPTFLGTKRTLTESRIIPTTWRENGVGIFGDHEQIAWRAVVINSLDGEGFSGSGVRGGRQKGSRAVAEDFSAIGRVDWIGHPGLIAGASLHVGNTGQGREVAGEVVDGRLVIWDLHADYRVAGFEARALVAGSSLSDVAELNALAGNTGADGVGSRMRGWYLQFGYDVLRNTGSAHQLVPYVGYERVDTQREVATGFTMDPANDMTITSVGLGWRPVSQVVVKVDRQFHSNAANSGLDQVNFQIGWLF